MAAIEADGGGARAAARRGRRGRGEPQLPQTDGDLGPDGTDRAAVEWCAERDSGRHLPVSCAFHSPQVAGARDGSRPSWSARDVRAGDPGLLEHDWRGARVRPGGRSSRCCAGTSSSRCSSWPRSRRCTTAGARVFVEVGPRSVLTGLTGQILADREHFAVPSTGPAGPAVVAAPLSGGARPEGVPVAPGRLLRAAMPSGSTSAPRAPVNPCRLAPGRSMVVAPARPASPHPP